MLRIIGAAVIVAVTIGVAVVSASLPAVAQGVTISPKEIVRAEGTAPFTDEAARLLAVGTERHGDTSLSPAGRSCNTCHLEEDSYNATFKKPWPHYVASVKRKAGLDAITAEGMVQFCMISAMGNQAAGLGFGDTGSADSVRPTAPQ